jgi:ribonucleoside-triphosphate reductase (thioredoxin)
VFLYACLSVCACAYVFSLGAWSATTSLALTHTRMHGRSLLRLGWVESVRLLMDSYFSGTAPVVFDYTLVRPAGAPIRGFGGVASGPAPLRDLHTALRHTLAANRGRPPSVTSIVDCMNLIGRCVVSGNVRQTAEIALGRPDADDYIDLKDYTKHPHRAAYGWTSNNSVVCRPGHVHYGPICERVRRNGEPGFFFLENAQRYGRMDGRPDGRDWRARGGNPCLEQTLEPYELCCLVETFPAHHRSRDDFMQTLAVAFEYAKTVSLGLPHWPETAEVVARNRRIGTSLSGLAQFITHHGPSCILCL